MGNYENNTKKPIVVEFEDDVNNKISKQLHNKANAAIYKTLVDSVNNRYVTVFCRNMQDYITRLGLIISSVSKKHKMKNNTYLGAIKFINSLLPSKYHIGDMLKSIGVNDAGNDVKHTIKNVSIDIQECLHQYNRMIKILIDEFKLTSLEICYIKYTIKKDNYRDKPLIEEQYYIKYFVVAGIKMSVELSDGFSIDKYAKTIQTRVIIRWPENCDNYIFDCNIFEEKSRQTLFDVKDIQLNSVGFKSYDIVVNNSLLDRRKLSIVVKITVYEKEYYTTGHLFWKEYKVARKSLNDSTKALIISQIY